MKTLMRIFMLFTFCFLLGRQVANANNANITNVSVIGSDISFDISWDNSWYAGSAPNNWDAVWVFVKYKDCSTTNWQHGDLTTNPADHSIGGGVLQVDTVMDAKGVFIRRSAIGSGNIATATATLRLNIPPGTYNFKVFGIEMVKILNENFDIGDGSASNRFSSITITSEASVSVGGLGTVDPMSAAYPKGWDAFYCMKYEVTQEQYKEFLNTLTYDQQNTRIEITPNAARLNFAMVNSSSRYRNYIQIDSSGLASTTPALFGCNLDGYTGSGTGAFDAVMNEANDGMDLACNFLSWYDLTAYLDWAALRPMTDLEFEKICRGGIGRVAGEYTWGSTSSTQARGNLTTNSGQAGEISNASGAGLCASSYSFSGVMRSGFAATATTTRITSGATYYGALDMGGNTWERVVATDADGKTFTGTNGDGILDASGNATNADWPGVSTTGGWGRRGSSFYSSTFYIQTSNRLFAYSGNTTRDRDFGGRGVR